MTAADLQRGDVVRARRYGNRTLQTYVIDRAVDDVGEHSLSVYAHREYGAGRERFMVLDARTARVIRSYR